MDKNKIKNLNAKDKMLIVKAIADIATKIYKDNADFILNQIIKNDKYISNYGQFYKSTNEEKTVAEIIVKKQKELSKLKEEIAELEKLDKFAIHTEEKTNLVSKHSAIADDIANELLEDIIENLDSKRLSKSASKIKRG